MNPILEQLSLIGIVPVVAIDDAKYAVPLASAMAKGGIPCAEVTLRTAAGLDAIRSIATGCPDVLVGAGTVLTLDQCKAAVEAGAKFIVSPGFNPKVVDWCLANQVAVLPGCVTPTEITMAVEAGLDTVKFFPADVYGGLAGMKALSAPFNKMHFIPTGGVNAGNLAEYLSTPYISAVGGSWVCTKADIAASRFDKITALCHEARQIALGYELAHVGLNMDSTASAAQVARQLSAAFGFAPKAGSSSHFAGTGVEVMHEKYLGEHGHIAIRTANIARAIADLESRGFRMAPGTEKQKDGKLIAVYLEQEFGGFAVHLLQK
jgi:2-dehydro-3-deoxyphosphogluconate aldolase/(4S)-4-hydroxy-2-oxoglutarate aldolase